MQSDTGEVSPATLPTAPVLEVMELEPEPAQSSVVGVVDGPASAGGESKHSDVAAALMCMGSSDAAVLHPCAGMCRNPSFMVL